MNHYETLGVDKSATQEDIRKAYKKLVLEHHPDRGGDHDYFSKINNAYEVLKDPVKKQQYDNTLNNDYTFNSFNINDLFSSFMMNQRYQRNRDVKLSVTMELEEVLSGKEMIINYTLFSGEQTFATIKIPAGVEHGEAIRFKGIGDNSVKNVPRGDLIVFVKVLQHKIYERDRSHLKIVKHVNVLDLMLGTKIEIETLDKKIISVNIAKGTQPGTMLSVPGYGLPDHRSNVTGNLYIVIKGVVPNIQNEEHLERIRNINNEINNSK